MYARPAFSGVSLQRAPAALILFSGSGRLTEDDIVTFFRPLSPSRILKLIPSSFFILVFPSIAAADAAVNQRSESCLHLLAAGAEQLKSLQAYERMLLQKYLEAEEPRARNSQESQADGAEEHMAEETAVEEVEMEDEEMAEETGGRNDDLGTTAKKSSRNGGQNGEKELVEDSGEKKTRRAEEKEEGLKEEKALPKPPEVFWLLEDVEANLDADEKEHFLRQVDCWRR